LAVGQPLHKLQHTSADSATDSFDTSTSHFPFPSPTAPAPGPSLLDDNESKFLDSFFDGVSSDQFSYDFFNNHPDGSELGLGWDELPPTFMGTTSSFGPQPQAGNHGLPDMSFGNMNSQMNPGPSIPSTSADVLAAAALLQNGSHGRSQSLQGGLFREDISRPTNGQLRQQSMSQQTPRSQAAFQERSGGDGFMRDNFYTEMMFGPQDGGSSIRHRAVSQKVDIRWGSDAGFGIAQGFVPPDNQENVAASERSHIKAVEEAFSLGVTHVPSSAETTHPPSPIGPPSHQRTRSIGQKLEPEDLDSRPRKRRKSKYQEVDEDDESSASPTFKPGTKKRKSKMQSEDSPGPESEQASKRRKSAAAAAAKAVRENLTEEQKRENHIKSEQKRRTLIREGFEDLGELVPGLKGGGFSKSAVLIMAADWLEELIHGNEILQRRLDQLEGR